MLIPTVALNYLANRLISNANIFDHDTSFLAVGDSDAALALNQTDLQGTNKVRVAMDIGYPKIVDDAVVFQATFVNGVAEWEWKEWAIFNGGVDSTMLCRVVENNSTKIANQTWVFQATVQFVSS